MLARTFARNADELARIALFLDEIAAFAAPARRLKVLADEPDNRILECALAGEADAIITGDRAMLALREYRGVRILTLAAYLDRP